MIWKKLIYFLKKYSYDFDTSVYLKYKCIKDFVLYIWKNPEGKDRE